MWSGLGNTNGRSHRWVGAAPTPRVNVWGHVLPVIWRVPPCVGTLPCWLTSGYQPTGILQVIQKKFAFCITREIGITISLEGFQKPQKGHKPGFWEGAVKFPTFATIFIIAIQFPYLVHCSWCWDVLSPFQIEYQSFEVILPTRTSVPARFWRWARSH